MTGVLLSGVRRLLGVLLGNEVTDPEPHAARPGCPCTLLDPFAHSPLSPGESFSSRSSSFRSAEPA